MQVQRVSTLCAVCAMLIAACATNQTPAQREYAKAVSGYNGRAVFRTHELTDPDLIWARGREWLERMTPVDTLVHQVDTLATKTANPWVFNYRITRTVNDSLTTFHVAQYVDGFNVSGSNVNYLAAYLAEGSSAMVPSRIAARRRHAIYVEYGGQSMASLNYEYYAVPWVSLRAGAGYGPKEGLLTLPLGFSIRRPASYGFEVSGGFTFATDWPELLKDDNYFPSLSIAFRGDPIEGGLMYRISIGNAWYLSAEDSQILIGFALGYSF